MSFNAPTRDKAERFFAQRKFQEAHAVCMEVLRQEPKTAWPYALLGRIAASHNTFDKAADLYQRAWTLEPDEPEHAVNLAFCLNGMNRVPHAVATAERALLLGPAEAEAFDILGVIFSRGNRQDLAVVCFRKAAALAPKNPGYLLNLGWAEQFTGDFEAAAQAWRASIALAPNNDRAWSALVRLEKQTPENNAAPQLERLFAGVGADPERRLQVGHALAKTYEDLGDNARSLEWLVRAKEMRRQRVKDLAGWQDELFDAATATATGAVGQGGLRNAEPLFVFGLPRSGTTLVERLLTSHPRVVSAGEPMDFALLTRQLGGSPTRGLIDGPTLAAASAKADMTTLGRQYLTAVRARTPGGSHFIDKTPLNVLYAGLINRALPDARMICLRRDPVDSCLSIFRQLFAGDFAYYDWVYDLADVGRFYVAFDRLVAHWRATLPENRFLEVVYEELVADQEGQSRRILDWLGLPWDDAVLSFHENAAPVSTASAVQVRSPVYSSSVGRWKAYGEGLRPLLDVLAEAGLIERDTIH